MVGSGPEKYFSSVLNSTLCTVFKQNNDARLYCERHRGETPYMKQVQELIGATHSQGAHDRPAPDSFITSCHNHRVTEQQSWLDVMGTRTFVANG